IMCGIERRETGTAPRLGQASARRSANALAWAMSAADESAADLGAVERSRRRERLLLTEQGLGLEVAGLLLLKGPGFPHALPCDLAPKRRHALPLTLQSPGQASRLAGRRQSGDEHHDDDHCNSQSHEAHCPPAGRGVKRSVQLGAPRSSRRETSNSW